MNNAGRFESVALEAISVEAWDAMFAVNVRGPYLMAQACYPHLKGRMGRIVNVGSLGRAGGPGLRMGTTALRRPHLHSAFEDDGEGVGAGGERELRGAGEYRAG